MEPTQLKIYNSFCSPQGDKTMSERAQFTKSEPVAGKPVDTRSYGDRVDATAQNLLNALRDEIYGKDGARATVKKILHDSACGGRTFLNDVLREADRREDVANSTPQGRKTNGYPEIQLINSSSDKPLAPPVALMTTRTESSPMPALHGMLPFLRIDGFIHTVPSAGSGDACKPKPHGKPLAPRG